MIYLTLTNPYNMASQETNIMHRVMIAISKLPNARIFRNNTGTGWAGQSYAQGSDRVVINAFPLKAGLCTGSSDLIGITTVTVTPEMIGQEIGIFTAIETKTFKGGKGSDEQKAFLKMVQERGGIAGIARSEAEALELINRFGNTS